MACGLFLCESLFEMVEKRDTRFKKGHPGGPGRPPGTGIVKRCKDWAEKLGFEFLERIAEGKEKEVSKKKANLKLRAHVAMYLVDRGHGRIPQPLDLSGLDLPAPLNIDFSGISKQDLRKIAKMREAKK